VRRREERVRGRGTSARVARSETRGGMNRRVDPDARTTREVLPRAQTRRS
jgi:hypothetical protein